MAEEGEVWVKHDRVSHSFSRMTSKAINLGEFGGETNWQLEAEVGVEAGWKERQEEVI